MASPLQGTLLANKNSLRKTVTAVVRGLNAPDIQKQSQAITERILSSQYFSRCRSICCYLSMPAGEVDTNALAYAVLANGKTLFVPKVDPTIPGRMKFLKIYNEDDLCSLPSGKWGIKEPDCYWSGSKRLDVMDADAEGLDLVVVPGVAFDHSGSRLGHGKGYYDRFITSYTSFASRCGLRRPLLVALSLRQQLLGDDQVKTGEHDVKMDVIVTPDIVIDPDGQLA